MDPLTDFTIRQYSKPYDHDRPAENKNTEFSIPRPEETPFFTIYFTKWDLNSVDIIARNNDPYSDE